MQATVTAEKRIRQPNYRLLMAGVATAFALVLLTAIPRGLWLWDASGEPIATDFINVWAAGRLVLDGTPAAAYDWTIHKAVEDTAVGGDFSGYFGWHYPPPFLMIAAALALLPYTASLLVWMLVSLPLYLAAMRRIAGTTGLLAALAWPATAWNIAVGQNGFLTAALLGGGLALMRQSPVMAGVLIGLLTYKPQFGLLIPLALVAGGDWRVFVSASLSALALAALSAVVLGVSPWIAFLQSLEQTNSAVLVAGNAHFYKLQSVFGFIRSLDGGLAVAWAAQIALILALAVLVWRLWRSNAEFEVKAAALAVATLLASPYVYVYDLVALSIPLAFVGRHGFSVRETIVVLAVAALVVLSPSESVPTGLIAMLSVLALAMLRWRANYGR